MKGWKYGYDLSIAERTGFFSFIVALLLGFISFNLAAIPLVLFLLSCLCAPFLPRSSFFLPVMSRGKAGFDGVALTFDDGPTPSSTPVLIELLAKYRLQATFFVVGRNASAYPELIDMILAHGHTIGNHSYSHDNFLMLRSMDALKKDILNTQEVLATSGIRPLLFRPPVGITNPRLKPVLADLGLKAVTFSCRVFDRGNRNISHLAARVLQRLQPGDVLLLHDSPPANTEVAAAWFREIDQLLCALPKLYLIAPLAELIGQPVMVPIVTQ